MSKQASRIEIQERTIRLDPYPGSTENLWELFIGSPCRDSSPPNWFLVRVCECVVGALLNHVMELLIVSNQRAALLGIAEKCFWSGQNSTQSFNSNVVAWGTLGWEMLSPGKMYYMVLVVLGPSMLSCPKLQYLLCRGFPKKKFLQHRHCDAVLVLPVW